MQSKLMQKNYNNKTYESTSKQHIIGMKFDICIKNIKNLQSNDQNSKLCSHVNCLAGVVTLDYNQICS